MNLDTSRSFPFTVLDESTGETRTLRAAASGPTEMGEDIIYIATGQAYRRHSAQALKWIRAEQFDLEDRELDDGPRSSHVQGDGYFNAQVFATEGSPESDIIRVRHVTDGVLEDGDGKRYRRTKTMRIVPIKE